MPHIRRASETDLESLVPLKISVHALHVARRPDVFKAMKPDEVAAWLRERLADDATHAWMAEDGENPVGYLLAIRREREETPFTIARHWCDIDEVAVHTSFRRRGIARALIERAAAHARESGLEAVELSTWAFNEAAQAAFARLGFQQMVVRYQLSGPSLA